MERAKGQAELSKRHEEFERMPRRLWSVKETAAYLGLPVATIYQLNYKGTGPRYYVVGRHRRYEPEDVMKWLSERASDARTRM